MKRNIPSYGERNDLAMFAWVRLFRSHQKIRTKETRWMEELGLTMQQFTLLELLYHRGSQSVGAATKLLMSTPGNMTVVVKNLEKKGLITVTADPADKRTRNLEISPDGAALIGGLFPEHAEQLAGCFLALDDEELRTLSTLLRKLEKSQ